MAADNKAKGPVLVFPPLPTTARGYGIHIDVTAKGNRMAYTNGNHVIIRSLDNAAENQIFSKHTVKANIARFSPNGEMMASGDDSGKLLIWNIKTQEIKKEVPVAQKVLDIAWFDDGQKIVAVGDGGNKARVFSVDTGSNVGEISGHSKAILAVTASPKRPFKIATVSEDKTMAFHAGPPFHIERTDTTYTNYVNSVRFSPDGSKIVAVSTERKIVLYDGASGQPTGSIESKDGHTGGIVSVCWSPDGTQLLTASSDKTVKLWNIADSSLAQTFTFGDDVGDFQVSVAWIGDRLISVSLSGAINFLDVANPAKPKAVWRGHQFNITAATVDAATQSIYTGDLQGNVCCWDSKSGTPSWLGGTGHGKSVLGISVDASHNTLVTAGLDNRVVSSDIKQGSFGDLALALDAAPTCVFASRKTPSLYVVSTTQPKVLLVKEHKIVAAAELKYKPLSVTLSPDDTHVVVGGEDKKVHVYQVNGQALTDVATFTETTGAVLSVAFTPNGEFVAAVDRDACCFFWNWETKQVANPLGWKQHNSSVTCCNWSPNSLYLTTCSVDRTLFVFTDRSHKFGSVNVKYPMAHGSGLMHAAFLDDSTVVSVGDDRAIKIWRFQ